ncbi:MAG: gliding motility-associated ABC transporter substrate-binding protein GldG [Candidatus Dadabacteria bacterium]
MGRRTNKKLVWLGLLAALVLINFIAAKIHYRADLTQEKRYSITHTTKNLLHSLDGDLHISVFLKGDFPAEFRRLSTTSQEFVSELREANPSRITYTFINPQDEAAPGKSWGDSLQVMGASPVNLSVQVKSGEENKLLFPYALINYKGYQSLINLFSSSKRTITATELNNAEAMMEYEYARAIDQMNNPQRASVAYAIGNGEPTNARVYDLQQVVRSAYNFGLFNIKAQKFIPKEIQVLLVVKPDSTFSTDEKLKIDQYIMNGGKVLWFIDNLHAEQDSLSYTNKLVAYERNLDIQDLLFNYGVRINPDLVMDLQCDFLPFAVGGSASNPQYEFLHWNYYPLFESKNNHLINKNLGLVAGRYVNSVDTIQVPGVKKTFLLQSSSNSRTISTPALISPNENRNTPTDAAFNQSGIPAAVLLEGHFTSFFRNRISKAQVDSLAAGGGFVESTTEPNKMIVVADGDIVLNDISPKEGPLPMGLNLFTSGSQYEYQFANRDFLMNCLEYLTSKTSIIETRNKEIVLRLLDTKKVDAEKSKWQLINIVLPILLIIIAGVIYQQVRRYRFGG